MIPIDRNFQKRNPMITKTATFKLLLHMLLIATFSYMNGSEKQEPKKQGMLNFVRNRSPKKEAKLTPRQPATIDGNTPPSSVRPVTETEVLATEPGQRVLTEKKQKEAEKIADYLAERDKFEVVDKPKETTEPKLTTVPSASAVSCDSLGISYVRPTLSAQTAKVVATSRGLFALTAKRIEDYLDKIIQNGEFYAAHSIVSREKQYPKIGEDSGEALTANVATFITMLRNQNNEKTDLFKKHRQEFATFSNRLRRLVLANQESYAKGSISQQRIEGGLENLEDIQKIFEESNNLLVLELDAQEQTVENMRKEILDLHPTATSQPQISNRRKLIIEQPK